MIRVASLYLPQLPIERMRRLERPITPPDAGPALRGVRFPQRIDENPGACTVPRGGGWRPGARWARDGALGGRPSQDQSDALPAYQRPPLGELRRGSDHADHPFKAMPSDEGGAGGSALPSWSSWWGRPTILVARTGLRDVVTAVCPLASEAGLRPGMAAAHARALIVDLAAHDANPAADLAFLDRLALHAVRHWTPTASVSGSNGLWLDLTGTTHLFGGEEKFCRRLLHFMKRLGFTASIAIAGTPGAAHALARYSGRDQYLLPSGAEAQALADLPLAALRLEPEILAAADRFGLERVADLYPMPRGPLAKRLGMITVRRLDQARGAVAEPIVPVQPFEEPRAERRLLEPISTAEAIAQVIGDLVDDLTLQLQARGLGLRAGVLNCTIVDGGEQRVVIGTARATRDARHLKRMLVMRIERIEPGLGIEVMALAAPRVEELQPVSLVAQLGDEKAAPDIAPLIDELGGRVGPDALFRMTAQESDVPERAAIRVAPLAKVTGWPTWRRPVRLLRKPELLARVVALLPDHPPRRFTWRRQAYRIVAGDGPERIHGEWWRNAREMWAVRDYFRVEAEGGERFWVFRRGDGINAPTGDLSWYMHGLFG